jgi:UrcA family protein
MSTSITARVAGSRRKFALLMLMGSLGCALGVGTAVAQTSDNDVPRIVLHYTAQTLATDNGVQQLYRQIVHASKQVCPDQGIHDLAAHASALQCQKLAVARAIHQIDSSELAALYATTSKRG